MQPGKGVSTPWLGRESGDWRKRGPVKLTFQGCWDTSPRLPPKGLAGMVLLVKTVPLGPLLKNKLPFGWEFGSPGSEEHISRHRGL